MPLAEPLPLYWVLGKSASCPRHCRCIEVATPVFPAALPVTVTFKGSGAGSLHCGKVTGSESLEVRETA